LLSVELVFNIPPTS